MKPYFVWIFIVGLLITSPAFGETNDRVTLTGTITDHFGSLIPEVHIVAGSAASGKFETRTGADGVFKLDLKPDIYTLTITKAPFNQIKLVDYQVARNRKIMVLDISMICESCEETSVVTSGRGEVLSLPSRDTRQKVIERLFPRIADIDWRTQAYVLEVKEIPSFGAPSQVSVVKTLDGALTVRKYFLANQQDMITNQLAELGEPVKTMSVEELITRLDVRVQEIQPKRTIFNLVEQFFVTPIRVRVDTSVTLDEARYECGIAIETTW